jgi:hypothetical protein
MGNFIKAMLFGIILFGLSLKSAAQKTGLPPNQLFGRKYKPGEVYRYKLTMTEYHNSELQFTNVSVCELKVIDSAGVFYDQVRWISKKVMKPKDTVDQTSSAILVKPYYISLDGRGRIDLPKIEVSELTEPIQDFNTFFVAVSPQIGSISQLKKTGDSISMKDPVKADFSNATFLLKGEDCLSIRAKLVNTTSTEAFLYTSFMAPDQPCLTYIIGDMNTPVADKTVNNFQMVSPSGKDLFNVNYGREYFYINSTIRKADGKIVSAAMYNQLNLKIKVNCNAQYNNCQIVVPFAEQRKLTLELL